MPKVWRHEAAVQRTEALIAESSSICSCRDCKEWDNTARQILQDLRAGDRQTRFLAPLVLHCIDVAGRELADRRPAISRLFLLVARALVDQKMKHSLLRIYTEAFCQGQPDMPIDALKNLMAVLAGGKIPDGVSTVQFTPDGPKVTPLKVKKKKPGVTLPPPSGDIRMN